jgi:hypothetical protein
MQLGSKSGPIRSQLILRVAVIANEFFMFPMNFHVSARLVHTVWMIVTVFLLRDLIMCATV